MKPIKLHKPDFNDHVGIEEAWQFLNNKCQPLDLSYLDSINFLNLPFEQAKNRKELWYVTFSKPTFYDDHSIRQRGKITTYIITHYVPKMKFIEIGSAQSDDVPNTISGQELQVIAYVSSKYPQHFNKNFLVKGKEEFKYIKTGKFYTVLKGIIFKNKSEIAVYTLAHCMFFFLKEQEMLKARRASTTANRFALFWLYEYKGQKVDWENSEFSDIL